MRFEDMGYVIVRADGAADRRRCEWEREGEAWRCAGVMPFRLESRAPHVVMKLPGSEVLLEKAPPKRIAALEKAAKEAGQPHEVCERAEQCCVDGMPLLGATCNVEVELAGKSSTLTCRRFISGIRILLVQKRVDIPPSCTE